MSTSNDVSEHLLDSSTNLFTSDNSSAGPSNYQAQLPISASANLTSAARESLQMTIPLASSHINQDRIGGMGNLRGMMRVTGSPTVPPAFPFLSAVDSLTSVSPILQSLFSRIEAEFQNLMQENQRLQSENTRRKYLLFVLHNSINELLYFERIGGEIGYLEDTNLL